MHAKNKMFRYFTFNSKWRQIDQLDQLIESYNATPHCSIGVALNGVNAIVTKILYVRVFTPKIEW